jgi:hypothetical protein
MAAEVAVTIVEDMEVDTRIADEVAVVSDLQFESDG